MFEYNIYFVWVLMSDLVYYQKQKQLVFVWNFEFIYVNGREDKQCLNDKFLGRDNFLEVFFVRQ